MYLAPPSRSGTTNMPMAGMKVSVMPTERPGTVCGQMACQKMRAGPAYRSFAASTSAQSSFSTLAYSGMATKGRKVATMPRYTANALG